MLDFDCECRPLDWYGGDFNSKEVTAIAWAWLDNPTAVTCVLLAEMDVPSMLRAFVRAYETADMVIGHYILGFDLPFLNGQLTEYEMPVLGEKLVHDTKIHMVKRHGLSTSQENLGAMLGLQADKVQMNQTRWRQANRLTKEGTALARKRAMGDVKQHIEMYMKLSRLGYLRSPKPWSCGADQPEASYTP